MPLNREYFRRKASGPNQSLSEHRPQSAPPASSSSFHHQQQHHHVIRNSLGGVVRTSTTPQSNNSNSNNNNSTAILQNRIGSHGNVSNNNLVPGKTLNNSFSSNQQQNPPAAAAAAGNKAPTRFSDRSSLISVGNSLLGGPTVPLKRTTNPDFVPIIRSSQSAKNPSAAAAASSSSGAAAAAAANANNSSNTDIMFNLVPDSLDAQTREEIEEEMELDRKLHEDTGFTQMMGPKMRNVPLNDAKIPIAGTPQQRRSSGELEENSNHNTNNNNNNKFGAAAAAASSTSKAAAAAVGGATSMSMNQLNTSSSGSFQQQPSPGVYPNQQQYIMMHPPKQHISTFGASGLTMMVTISSMMQGGGGGATTTAAAAAAAGRVEQTWYDLPLLTRNLFETRRRIKKLHDWQRNVLMRDDVRNGQNFVYSLPTSGGKTLVAEIILMRCVKNRNMHGIFIVPFVALAEEKVTALQPFGHQLDFNVEAYAGTTGRTPVTKKVSIFVATMEKANGIINSLIQEGRSNELGCVVVDELHMVGDESRGQKLENLLTKIRVGMKHCQIVGMSATIPNLPQLADWLGATYYVGDYRPVPLTQRLVRASEKGDATLFELMTYEQRQKIIAQREKAAADHAAWKVREQLRMVQRYRTTAQPEQPRKPAFQGMTAASNTNSNKSQPVIQPQVVAPLPAVPSAEEDPEPPLPYVDSVRPDVLNGERFLPNSTHKFQPTDPVLVEIASARTFLPSELQSAFQSAATREKHGYRLNAESKPVLHLVMESVNNNEGSALVFCSSRRGAEEMAIDIAVSIDRRLACMGRSRTDRVVAQLKESSAGANLMRDHERLQRKPNRGPRELSIIDLVQAGVAYHHAQIHPEWKVILETAYRNKDILVLTCTSTLAAGVNLPARRAVIVGAMIGPNALDKRNYFQMCGRAGRAGLDAYGESYLVLTEREFNVRHHQRLMLHDQEPVKSRMGVEQISETGRPEDKNVVAGLARAMIDVLSSGMTSTEEGLFQVTKSFLYFHTVLKCDEQLLEQKFADALNFLERHEFIKLIDLPPEEITQQQQQQQQQQVDAALVDVSHRGASGINHTAAAAVGKRSGTAVTADDEVREMEAAFRSTVRREPSYSEEDNLAAQFFSDNNNPDDFYSNNSGLVIGGPGEDFGPPAPKTSNISPQPACAGGGAGATNFAAASSSTTTTTPGFVSANVTAATSQQQHHVEKENNPNNKTSATHQDIASNATTAAAAAGAATTGATTGNAESKTNNSDAEQQQQPKDTDAAAADAAVAAVRTTKTSEDDSEDSTLRPFAHQRFTRKITITAFGLSAGRGTFTMDQSLLLRAELQELQETGLILTNDVHLMYFLTPLSEVESLTVPWEKFFYLYETVIVHNETLLRIANRIGIQRLFLQTKATLQTRKLDDSAPAEEKRKFFKHARFYWALVLCNILDEMDPDQLHEIMGVPESAQNSLKSSASTFASFVTEFCKSLDWYMLEAVLSAYVKRIGYGVKPDILPLVQLKCVTAARARMLWNLGFKTVKDLATVEPTELHTKVKQHLRHTGKEGNKLAKYFRDSTAVAIVREANALLKEQIKEKHLELVDMKDVVVLPTQMTQLSLLPKR